MKNVECGVRSSEFGMRNAEFRTPNSPFRTRAIPHSAFRIPHCSFLILLCLAAGAQEIELPPQAPLATVQPAVQPPTGIGVPGPPGQIPHQPSSPPTGYEPVPLPRVEVAGGVSVPVDQNLLRLDADFWRVDFEEGKAARVTARGNVRATYRNFSVRSASATADLRTKIATFSEGVVFTVNEQDVSGESLSINLETREWTFQSARSELRPEIFPELLRAPVFLSGQTITGRADDIATVADGGFTTCNLERPHYVVDADTATVWPARRLVARDATFYALGRKILRIPRLAIPLRQIRERQNLMPRLGQTAEEGLFLKAAYSYAATLRRTGNLKLDLMSRKGIGLGVEDSYNIGRGLGNLYLYHLSDRNRNLSTLTGRLTHEQRLGTVRATLTSDYRANSFQFSPQSTSLGNELRFVRSLQDTSTSLAVRQTLDRGFGRFSYLTSTLQHSQKFGQRSSADLNFDYFRSESPIFFEGSTIEAANSQLVSRLDYRRQEERYDWNLRMSKISDLSDEAFIASAGTRFAGTERLPELELTTTSERLKKTLPLGLPARLGLAVGRYREDLGRVDTERALVDIDIPSRVWRLADRLNLTTSAGFRQYLYGDDSAQYSVEGYAELARKIGDKSSAALIYRYLRPHGFTPFRFDFIGTYNLLNARVNLQETERFKLSLFAGYNFAQESFPWQDLTARMLYKPSDRYLLYTSTGYDLNRSQWRALINQVRVRLPNDFKLDLGTRYDVERSKFASIKTQLDVPVGDLWRVRANAGYNGFTRSFDYRNVQVVRDLHCWELALTWADQTGFWQERGLRLNLRIKAFPFFDSFGVGQFGQALDTSVGEIL